ncbi:MAG: hypothetical protein Q4G54_07630 [Pelistega sp.]|nr:hypothetical protein [Pelistega sp.]
MNVYETPYNQIDFVILAPRFRIVFSCMSDKNVAFVREYLLRLLYLTPCKPEQIAHYFGFNHYETEVSLEDLARNKWILWTDDGTVEISSEGMKLFHGSNDDSPKIPSLNEYGGEYRMELLDNNFLLKKDCDSESQHAIKVPVESRVQSECNETARKVFQSRFRQLCEDDIIQLDAKDTALYKIDVIETKGSPVYFRFTQKFELFPATGESKERHDIVNLLFQDNIQKAVTELLAQFRSADNLHELSKSMEALGCNFLRKILFGGKLDFLEFLNEKHKREQQSGMCFLGQIYHQEDVFEKINTILNDLDKNAVNPDRKLLWLVPNDIYWGKQKKIHDKVQSLVEQQSKGYKLRLYLPLSKKRTKHEIDGWRYQFKDIQDDILFGFCEGFLDGNTEILFLKNKFAVVCYHIKLSGYPVTLPLGYLTTKLSEVKGIEKLANSYLNSTLRSFKDNNDIQKDFGILRNLVD